MRARPRRAAGEVPPAPGADGEVGEALRAAREAAGLSQRELARATGVSQATISSAERGRPVHLSTLQALARGLPALDAAALLGRPGAPRPASRTQWEWMAAALGFSFDRVALRHERRRDGSQAWSAEVTGIRTQHGTPDDPAVKTRLLRAACLGPPALLAQLTFGAGDDDSVLEADGVRHVFRASTSRDRHALGYSLRAACADGEAPPPGLLPACDRPFADGIAYWVQAPVRRLSLSVRLPEGRAAAVGHHVWPAVLGLERTGGSDAWRDVHPGVPAVTALPATGGFTLEVERPVTGACYGLSWDGHAARAAGPPRSSRLVRTDGAGRAGAASVLRRARRCAGLTVRGLAERSGISPASVSAVERGREALLATVRGLLSALPDVSAHEMLGSVGSPSDLRGAWAAQRDLFGLDAEEERRIVRIAPDGHVRYVARTIGLACTNPAIRSVRIRHGLEYARHVQRPHVLESVRAPRQDDEPKIRVLRGDQGPLIHEVRLSPRGRSRGASYERELVVGRRLALRRGEDLPPDDRGPDWPSDAVYVALAVPARRLQVDLHFPPGLLPERLSAVVLPQAFLPQLHGDDLGPRVHADGLELTVSRSRACATLRVERPLVGLQYGVGWLPG